MNDKPLVIRIREAKQTMVAALNAVIAEQNLPFYLIEPIISELHATVTNAAAKEYEAAVNEVKAKTE